MDSEGRVSVFVFSLLLTIVSSQQNVVSVNTIQDGGSFMVYCDANRVTFPVSGVQDISILTLHRQTVGSNDYDMIAQYKTFGSAREIENDPAGRQWTINFSGENGGLNNRNTMKIEITVPDARCDDAGLYKCTVRYTNPTDSADAGIDSPEQNVTAVARISQLTMTLDPDTGIGDGGTAVYYERQYLQMTCMVHGPEHLRMVWTQKSDFGSFFSEYPIANDITPQTSNPATLGSCNEYIHETKLSLNLTQFNNDGYTYRCEVRPTQTGPTVMSRNVTLALEVLRCPFGIYGFQCNKHCSQSCGGDRSCDTRDGHCLKGCQAGFTGLMCDNKCESGKYGKDCTSSCSQFCNNNGTAESPCHYVSGFCLRGCQTGYLPPLCLTDTDNNLGLALGLGIGSSVLVVAGIVCVSIVLYRRLNQSQNDAPQQGGRSAYDNVGMANQDDHSYHATYKSADNYDLPRNETIEKETGRDSKDTGPWQTAY